MVITMERAAISMVVYWDGYICSYKLTFIYSVMQSDGNSFYGDVVSESFKKTSRDVDKILDQTYKSKYIRIIIMMILILYIHYTKIHTNTKVSLKPNFMSSLLLCAVSL